MANRFLAAFCLIVAVAGAAYAARVDARRETPVVAAVREAAPAVVNISTEIITRQNSPFGNDPFFDKFFRDFFSDSPGFERRGDSLGTGVVVDARGHILTNEHVIRNASRIVVTFINGEKHDAKLVGADARTDLAVLKLTDGAKPPYVEMGQSDDLMIGETVIAIGNPFGLSHTVTTGVVSAVNRSIRGGDGRTYSDFIQTDASINPGNSGGPLLNIEGRLIGINAAIYQSAEGIGFAIPIDKARRIMADLINFGEVHRAWLGVQVQDVDEDIASHYGLKKAQGVLVSRVFKESPAFQGGLKRGDLLLSLNSSPVQSKADFYDKLAGFTANSNLKLVYRRGDDTREATLTTRTMPKAQEAEFAREWLGLGVTANSEKLARRNKLPTTKGVVVTEVAKGSEAKRIGIEPGDLILKVNDAPVDSEEEFATQVSQASMRETVVLVVHRGRVAYHVTLTP